MNNIPSGLMMRIPANNLYLPSLVITSVTNEIIS